MKVISWLASALVLAAGVAHADVLEDKVNAALASDARTEAEKARDANRKPLETLRFFGLEDDMRVIELIPGGGWYTKVLAPVLRDNGQLYVAIGAGRVGGMLDQPGFEGVELLDTGTDFERTEPFGFNNISGVDFGVDDVDMVLTFRNLHNFTPEARKIINEAAFDALKSGGLYGAIDHTARHMEPITRENRRRMDPVLAIKEILDAGFELVDYSDLHYRPDDELRYEVGRRSVTGNTDRFTLLFRKP